jgi:hypothetical protein
LVVIYFFIIPSVFNSFLIFIFIFFFFGKDETLQGIRITAYISFETFQNLQKNYNVLDFGVLKEPNEVNIENILF